MKILAFLSLLTFEGWSMDVSKYKGNVSEKTIKNYNKVEQYINYASDAYNVPRWLLSSLLFIESKFDNNARSYTGVTGVAQLTSSTAKHFGISKATISGQIHGMAKILRHHINNLPDTYTIEEKYELASLFYSGGKGNSTTGYWFAKKRHGSGVSVDSIVKYYRLETRNYLKSLRKVKGMFL